MVYMTKNPSAPTAFYQCSDFTMYELKEKDPMMEIF